MYVPECPAELVVVHVSLVLLVAPLLGHLVGLDESKLSDSTLPDDQLTVLLGPGQQLQEELPKLDLTGGVATAGRGGAAASTAATRVGRKKSVIVVLVDFWKEGSKRTKCIK